MCVLVRAWKGPAVAFRSTQGAFQVLRLNVRMRCVSSRCEQALGPVSRRAASSLSTPSLLSGALSALLHARKGKETRGALSQRETPCTQGRLNSSYSQIPHDLLFFFSEDDSRENWELKIRTYECQKQTKKRTSECQDIEPKVGHWEKRIDVTQSHSDTCLG